MAMRPPRGSVTQPRPPMHGSVIQQPPRMRPTYENFNPRSEWKYEDDATILLLYLPGFLKERIRTEIIETSGSIKIQGERSLGGGRWRTFNQNYTVPNGSDITKINTRFELGILTIVIPKKKPPLITTPNIIQPKITTATQDKTHSTTKKVDDDDHDKKSDHGIKEKIITKTEPIPDDDHKKPKESEKPHQHEHDDEKVVKKDTIGAPPPLQVKEKEKSSVNETINPKEENHDHDHHLIADKSKDHMKHKSVVDEKETAVKQQMSDQGQVLLNVFVAVIVLMGLGAQISSTIASSKTH
ncbi:hypothetical protein LWI28_024701 [Acer negundo]|uniref:SHSP domain-containing protein n=1 Tax=Acer negundo TaxID=4023 RepID=A0AAD5IAN0_ACENE|nr:hypothetical protein LWI28_024701 [Acer negundo]KAK4835183.1 hypothetical protein QYF36_006465 [Acer negundo]